MERAGHQGFCQDNCGAIGVFFVASGVLGFIRVCRLFFRIISLSEALNISMARAARRWRAKSSVFLRQIQTRSRQGVGWIPVFAFLSVRVSFFCACLGNTQTSAFLKESFRAKSSPEHCPAGREAILRKKDPVAGTGSQAAYTLRRSQERLIERTLLRYQDRGAWFFFRAFQL